MLTQYLNHNNFFRTLFAIPIAIRRSWLRASRAKVEDAFERTIVGGDVILRPDNFDAQFKVAASSDLAHRVITTGGFEREITSILDRLTYLDGDIVNVGANIGFYAIYFATHFENVEKVYAIEPNPEAFRYLQGNIVDNGCSNKVEAIQICIGKEAGQIDFAIIPGKPEYSSIGRIVHPSTDGLAQGTISVKIATLEDALSSQDVNVTLMFVDTEGAELLVFQGAASILRKSMPLLFFECDDRLLGKFDHSSKQLEEYLQSLGYTVRDALDPRVSLQHPFVGEAVAFPSAEPDWVEKLEASDLINS